MNREDSALLASWLTFVVSAVTLVVTLVAVAFAGVALLSVDQVRRLVCRHLSYDCGFEGVAAHLLLFEVEPRKLIESMVVIGDDVLPPGLTGPPVLSAWELLAREVDPVSGTKRIEDLLSGAAPSDQTECLTSNTLAALPRQDAQDFPFIGERWQWKMTYASGPIDANQPTGTNGEPNLNPNSVGFEFTARYAQLHRDVHLVLRMQAFENEPVGPAILARTRLDYAITLPTESGGVRFVCPLPDLPPGRYDIVLATQAPEGDWEEQLGPLDLDIRAPPLPAAKPAHP